MAQPEQFAQGLSIGIIMDGNGRWAKKRGLPRTAGHKKGAEVFQDITRYCNEIGVESVYFYAFSTENWSRPAEEVGAIMRLFGEYLIKAFDYEKENNRVVFLGDRTALEPRYQKLMDEIEQKTAHNTGMTLNVAVNYGGRAEIVRAARALAEKVAKGELRPEDIDEAAMCSEMYTHGQKDPDFILRPSGEKRLSNFMLWQAAYSELVEMDVRWPGSPVNAPRKAVVTILPAKEGKTTCENSYHYLGGGAVLSGSGTEHVQHHCTGPGGSCPVPAGHS